MDRKHIIITSTFIIIILTICSIFASIIFLQDKLPLERFSHWKVTQTNIPGKLIEPSDLEYKGAFRLPEGSNDTSWEYSGTAATYYPEGDPRGADDGYLGSIFATGHEWEQQISEISIPEPLISDDINELNTALTLQEFHDVKDDLFGELELPRVGLEYLSKQGEQSSDKLYFAWGQHNQEGEYGPSHGWIDLDLSNLAGIWKIKDQPNYVTNDYLFEIPETWADTYVSGKRLATGRFREGGQGAQGPSLIAYGPWDEGNPPENNASLSNISLLLYSSVYEDPEGISSMENYQHSDEWSGGAWLTQEDKAAVIFVGIKGQGNCWYGFYDGTVWPEEPPYPEVGPGERGWWSDSFTAQMIFYDPKDLAKVAQGEMEPYEPQPYATLNFDEFLYNIPQNELRHLGALAYDRENGILYIFEFRGDYENERSLVHVWKIK